MPPKFNWNWSSDENLSPSHGQNGNSSKASTDGSSTNNDDENLPATPGSSFEEDPATFLESPTTWADVANTDATVTEPLEFPDFAPDPANAHLPVQLIEMSPFAFQHFRDIPEGFVRPMTFDAKDLWEFVFSWNPLHGIRKYIRGLAGYKINAYYDTNATQALAAIPADDNAGLRSLVETLEMERDDARDHLTIAVNVIPQVVNYSDDEWHKDQAEKAVVEKDLEDSMTEMVASEKALGDSKNQHEKQLETLKIQHDKELEDFTTHHEKDLRASQIAHIRAELHLIESKLDVEHLERSIDRHIENNTILFEKLQDSHMAFEYNDNLTAGYRDIAARQVENLKGQLRRANARIGELEEVVEMVAKEVEREVDEEWVSMIQTMDVGAECVERVNMRRRLEFEV